MKRPGWPSWLKKRDAPEPSPAVDSERSREESVELSLDDGADRLASAFDQSLDGMVLLDADGKALRVNRAWADMHELTPREAVGHHVSLFHTPDQMRDQVRPLVARVRGGGPGSAQVGHRRKGGGTFVATTTVRRILDDGGAEWGFLVVVGAAPGVDASAAGEVPPSDVPRAGAGEDGVGRRDRGPSEDAEELAALRRRLRLSAHGLNNLLTSLLGNLGLALEEAQSDPLLQEFLQTAEETALELVQTSEALLDLAHGGDGDGPPRPSSVRPEGGGIRSDGVATPAAAAQRQPATVLVVDNERGIRDFAVAVLERDGHRVLQASGGAAALEVFSLLAADIDLVLLDYRMPGMDGAEVLAGLRETAPEVRVVLMTGLEEREVQKRLSDEGLAGFLQKPFRRPELLAMLDSALP
ncbi:MAG: response regulator [Acidobacteriota bacterium]